MRVFPNVKINLGLHILRKREDGFHDIETVFLPYYGFHDTLQVEASQEFSISIGGPYYTGWNPETDLCARAYGLMRDSYGIAPVRIELEKTSPVGAGLGGGSADAAFVLRALSDMNGLNLPDRELETLAGRLGSDCAFFIRNRACFAEGRGEILSDLSLDLDGYEIRVEIPEGVSVSTKEAYCGVIPRSRRTGAGPSLREILTVPVSGWKEILENDFETSVFAAHPRIGALKNRMYAEGAVYAAMSGSGSAVFGLFDVRPDSSK